MNPSNPAARPPSRVAGVLLAVVNPPLSMLYLARWRWALAYLLVILALGLAAFLLPPPWGPALGALNWAVLPLAMFHAWRLAAAGWPAPDRPAYSRWPALLAFVAALAAGVLAVRAFVIEPFRVPAGSMLPTLSVGSNLLAAKWGYGNYRAYGLQLARTAPTAPVVRGDIVVFEFPRKRSITYVKRVIGLPGDVVAWRDGQLVLNGEAVATQKNGSWSDPAMGTTGERFIERLPGRAHEILVVDRPPASALTTDDFPGREHCTREATGLRCTVPADHLYVLGDNRHNSLDSRFWGFVPMDHLIGKVVWISP